MAWWSMPGSMRQSHHRSPPHGSSSAELSKPNGDLMLYHRIKGFSVTALESVPVFLLRHGDGDGETDQN